MDPVQHRELSALRRYQGRDRSYDLINRFLRRELDPASLTEQQQLMVDEVVTALDSLMRRWRTPEPLRVYRGLRRRDLDAIQPGANPARSFVSTTIDRDVAIREFTEPAGASGPSLMHIDVPVGVPAIWVPPLGDPILADQGELILDRRIRIAAGQRRDEDGMLVVDCEVLP